MSSDQKSLLFPKKIGQRKVIFAASIALVTGLISIYSFSRLWLRVHTPPATVTKPLLTRVAVTALGRIEPQGEVTRLFAPTSLNGARVEKMLVKQGDKVHSGQVVALLEGYSDTKAALQQAKDQVLVSQAKLDQVKAGAKLGDINAQKAAITASQAQVTGDVVNKQAEIARLKAELENAQTENSRYQDLYKQGAVSASVADGKALQLKSTQQQLLEAEANLNTTLVNTREQLKQAKARLRSIQEVRPVDVQLAQAELQSAISAVQQAKAQHDLTYLKSPINGKVLKVNAKTGEVNSTDGVLEIGQTSQMYVLAEIYQTDIDKVHLGQKAIITSTAFSRKLQGTVSEIGMQVDRQSIFSLNPTADTDRRIIQVKIRIDNQADSQRVADLTNLQVDVAIQI